MPFLSFRASLACVLSDLLVGAFFTPSAFSRKRELRSSPQESHKNTAPFRQSSRKAHHDQAAIVFSI